MIIVIDAYNVLKLFHEIVGDARRQVFVSDVRAYGKKKSHSMVVVFDGGPYQWPFSFTEKTVLVIYSGVNETADDSIKKFLENTPRGQALLVSSDRQLCLWASDHGTPSVGALDFYTIMSNVLSGKNDIKKQKVTLVKTGDSDEEIDNLMREAGDMVYDRKENVAMSDEELSSERLKKTDRKALRILKKLQ